MTNPIGSFKSIFDFLDVTYRDESLALAIEIHSAEKQRNDELSELMKNKKQNYVFAAKRDWSKNVRNKELVSSFLLDHDNFFTEYMHDYGYQYEFESD